jgi:DNA-binding transcriptional ArsR family regulator
MRKANNRRMPEILFQKDSHIKRVTTIGYRAAQALNDPVRIKILEILSHTQMSTEEIVKTLAHSGFKKATTTIRHHLDSLKSAGLIQATKMVEVRGAVMKYYSPTLRAFSYDAPADLEVKNAKLVGDTSLKLLKILKSVLEDKKFATAFDSKNKGCSLCKNDHFREYLALEILNAALARAMERKEYGDLINLSKDPAAKSGKALLPTN